MLLVIAAARLSRLEIVDREIHVDEVWSVWQLIGAQTDYTRDLTWPPLYTVLMDGWQRLTGIHIVTLRSLSVLYSLIGAAALYCAARTIVGFQGAVFATLIYAALPLSGFINTYARAYALVYALLPIALWLTVRYFARPGWRRAITLGVVMVAMFYTAYGAVGGYLLLGMYTLIVYRMQVWRWWLPGLIAAVLASPAIIGISGLVIGRAALVDRLVLPPPVQAISALYATLFEAGLPVWIGLIVIASVGSLIRLRRLNARMIGVLAWAVSPILFYALNRWLGLFSALYLWYVAVGLALWVAWGLTLLPRVAQMVSVIALIGLLITPVRFEQFQATPQPIGLSFEGLKEYVRWGDVLVIDPLWQDRYCRCVEPEMFDYLVRLYFPQGWRVVSDPVGYRRVWYLKWASLSDETFEQTKIQLGRIASTFIGPPEALFRLYEAPPDPVGIPFANGMWFHGVDLLDAPTGLLTRRAGDQFQVRLWWTVDRAPAGDYSIGLKGYLRDYPNKGEDRLVIQSDSGPQLEDPTLPTATSQWTPGRFYIETRTIEVPRSISRGELSATIPITMTVYQSWDGVRIKAPGTNADDLLFVFNLYIKAWG